MKSAWAHHARRHSIVNVFCNISLGIQAEIHFLSFEHMFDLGNTIKIYSYHVGGYKILLRSMLVCAPSIIGDCFVCLIVFFLGGNSWQRNTMDSHSALRESQATLREVRARFA